MSQKELSDSGWCPYSYEVEPHMKRFHKNFKRYCSAVATKNYACLCDPELDESWKDCTIKKRMDNGKQY